MTLQLCLDDLVKAFTTKGYEQPHVEARLLVQEALGITLSQILSQPDRLLDSSAVEKISKWKQHRLDGMPLAYLCLHKGFYKFDFVVEPGVLVPRPESELVVETALARLDDYASRVEAIADLGCGTGCIGLSLAAEVSSAHLWSIDLSSQACSVTQKNASLLNFESRATVANDKVNSWEPGVRFDLIVANPPYIAENDSRVDENVRRHEPHLALFSGDDGLEAMRQWSRWALRHLKPKGIFVVEFGSDQAKDVGIIFDKVGFEGIRIERDLAGHDRVASATKKGF